MRRCKLLLLFLLSISVLLSISKDALCDATNTTTPVNEVVNELRTNYRLFESAVTTAYTQDADTFLLQRLGNDIETFASIVDTQESIFNENSEWQTLRTNLQAMLADVWTIEFLEWAYTQRTTSGIAEYLGVARQTVRQALLDYGIAQPGINPFPPSEVHSEHTDSENDPVLDQDGTLPQELPDDVQDAAALIASSSSSSSYLSNLSDEDLDRVVKALRSHYARAGIHMLQGMLRRLGHIVPYERVRLSLIRIDPIHRVFDHIRIRRRQYKVPGPNSLWHHNGHHRNSVQNVRIERLWVDVSHYVSQHWHDAFTALEVHHDLDIQNVNHIWLIHHLFLCQINDSLAFWAESWNSHWVRENNGPSRSPEDRFGFDMFVQGFQGEALDQFAMSDEELEVFGIDWEGLEDEVLLRSLRKNYAHEDGTSTSLGRHGPPPNLNEVVVDPPSDLLTSEQLDALNMALRHIPRGSELGQIVDLWTNALAYVRTIFPGYF
ncbi:MAG: hypothetical protein NXY57DRAFT_906124 [Lentinula lateritia]|nr:MAG: hypothetical protein NXY57DRAFT_906124 [Lentinula lateritia]